MAEIDDIVGAGGDPGDGAPELPEVPDFPEVSAPPVYRLPDWPHSFPGPEPAGSRPGRRTRIALAVAASLLVVAVIAGMVVTVPYYLISPGEARGVAELVKVKGDGAKTFPPKGKILFTTVSLQSHVSAFQALNGWWDKDVQVIQEKLITGGAPSSQVREQNRRAMTDSKVTATKVALERLGYRVSVAGDGAVVTMVNPGDPADGQLLVDDVIQSVDGEAVTLSDQVVSRVRRHRPGDTISIGFRRGSTDRMVSLTSIAAPDGAARIGVSLQTHNLKYDFPVDVDIETGLVGGPSAGLAFTLALIDDLSEGELTGGRKVAVTGTIDADGNVGPVGGVAQKTVTARKAGAVAFLVPPDEQKEAKGYAKKMQIIPVKTLGDALAALHRLGGSEVAMPASGTAPHS